jgi:hypothetical protein
LPRPDWTSTAGKRKSHRGVLWLIVHAQEKHREPGDGTGPGQSEARAKAATTGTMGGTVREEES